MGRRNLSRGHGLLAVFICKLVVYDVNKNISVKLATYIQDHPDCRPYRDPCYSWSGGVLVVLCMFSLADRKATFTHTCPEHLLNTRSCSGCVRRSFSEGSYVYSPYIASPPLVFPSTHGKGRQTKNTRGALTRPSLHSQEISLSI